MSPSEKKKSYEGEVKAGYPTGYWKLMEPKVVDALKGATITIPEGSKVTWYSADKQPVIFQTGSSNWGTYHSEGVSYDMQDAPALKNGDTYTVSYEMSLDADSPVYKIMTGQVTMQMAKPSNDFYEFNKRFTHTVAQHRISMTGKNWAADHILMAKPEEIFPWPGWWDLICDFDQSVQFLVGKKEDLYMNFRCLTYGGIVFYPDTTMLCGLSKDQAATLMLFRDSFKKLTTETCAMCGAKATSTKERTILEQDQYKFHKDFKVYAVATCQKCLDSGVQYFG